MAMNQSRQSHFIALEQCFVTIAEIQEHTAGYFGVSFQFQPIGNAPQDPQACGRNRAPDALLSLYIPVNNPRTMAV